MDRNHLSAAIAAEFGIQAEFPASSPLEEAGFDSLRKIELVAYLEEMAGLEVGQAPSEYPVIETLEDATTYFDELVLFRLRKLGEVQE